MKRNLTHNLKGKLTTLPNPLVAVITEQETVRETWDTNIYGIAYWCNDYHKRTAYPCTILQRFIIAHYQLGQGMNWNDGCAKARQAYREYEGFASAALHLFMVGGALELDICDDYPEGIIDIVDLETKRINYEEFTCLLSMAAQMVFYAEKTFRQGYSRKSRFNPLKLQILLAKLTIILFGSIPSNKRSEAIEQASNIMTQRL